MKRQHLCGIAITALVLSGSAVASIGTDGRETPFDRIDADYRAGRIDINERAEYVVRAIKKPSTLPARYQAYRVYGAEGGRRCATVVLRDVYQSLDSLTAATRNFVTQTMTRWSTAFTYNSPSGFFKLHYDIVGTNAVSSFDGNGNTIPDYVEKCAAYMDTSLTSHQALGYLNPPSDGALGGDSKFDVYFEEMDLYGYAQPESPGPNPWPDFTSHLVLHRNFIGFPPNNDPEGPVAGAAKATAAHEFHHSVQFAYDIGEPGWFMELDATYYEDIAFDQVNDNYNYLGAFMSQPQVSLMDESIHMYASFIWGMYLAEKFDTSLMRAIWDGSRFGSLFTVMTDTLSARYGWSVDSAFADFVTWNYCTNTRDDGLHYQEGASYGLASIARQHVVGANVPLQAAPVSPQGYGSAYIRFVPSGPGNVLRLTFDGSNARDWAAYLIKSTATDAHQFQKLAPSAGSFADTIDIPNFGSYVNVVLAGANISEFSAGDQFSYAAALQSDYLVNGDILTNARVYPGSSRLINYRLTNVSLQNDTIAVIVQDSLGFVVADTSDLFVQKDSATVIAIAAAVPQGYALDQLSKLTIKATARFDPSWVVTDTVSIRTTIQRGDLNFDGLIDPSDLQYMVDFVFFIGPAPLPILESANFDCLGTVDGGDLGEMVDFFFYNGPRPFCNPY